MGTNQSFTIDKVGWHTQRPGNNETLDHISRRFRAIISFFQENGLAIHAILPSGEAITDDLAIASTHLTEDGLVLMRKCYNKWLRWSDRRHVPRRFVFVPERACEVEGTENGHGKRDRGPEKGDITGPEKGTSGPEKGTSLINPTEL